MKELRDPTAATLAEKLARETEAREQLELELERLKGVILQQPVSID